MRKIPCGCIRFTHGVLQCLAHGGKFEFNDTLRSNSMQAQQLVGHNKETAGYEWTVGQVYGVRSWNTDSLGRLVSPSYSYVWKPGENVAEIASHGFYAYTDTPSWSGSVKGIIKGYGKTTEGTRGFQCEKAEIVALTYDDQRVKPNLIRTAGAKFAVKFRLDDIVGPSLLAGFISGVTVMVSSLISAGMASFIPFIPAAVLIVLLGLFLLIGLRPFRNGNGPASGNRAITYLNAKEDKVPSLKELYPNVKFYKNVKSMLKDERLLAQVPPLPEPGTPEFWTYKA